MALRHAYYQDLNSKFGIQTVNGTEILASHDIELTLRRFPYSAGNVSPYEQLMICTLAILHLDPGDNFLEIGTFNGVITYNIANNLPTGSKVFTIDLPHSETGQNAGYSEGDLDIIRSRERQEKVHLDLENVEQIYADSAEFDFSKIDFSVAFIDGGHHYDIVKSDTQNVLRNASRPGLVMWHDFHAQNSVARVLREVANNLEVVNVESTSLGFALLR